MPLFSGNPPQYNGYPPPVQPPSLFSKLRQWLHAAPDKPRSAIKWDPEYSANAMTDAGYQRKALRKNHVRISEPVYPSPRPPDHPPFIPPPLPNFARSRSSGPAYGSQSQHPYAYARNTMVPSMSYPSKSQQSLSGRHNVYRARDDGFPSTPVHRSHISYPYPSQTHTGSSSRNRKLVTANPMTRSRSSSPRPRREREREERHRSHPTRHRDSRDAHKASTSVPRHHREREERHRARHVPPRALEDANRGRTLSASRPQPPRVSVASERYNFSLAAELIPSVSSYPSIDWNICMPLSSAFKWAGPNTKGPLRFETLAITPPVREVRIVARKENGALSLVIAKFGAIKVASKDENLTIGHILAEIRKYFHTPLHVREMDALTADVRNFVSRSYKRRWDAQDKEVMGEQWPKLAYWGPIRADMLFSFFQYAGLQMDERFAETRRLYLTLENRWSTRL